MKKNKTFCSRENFFPILRKKNCSVDQNVWTVSKKQKNTNSYMLGNFRKTQKQNLIKTCRRAKKTARPFIICIEGLRIANYFWERKNMFWVKKQRKQSKYSDFVTRQKMSFWGGVLVKKSAGQKNKYSIYRRKKNIFFENKYMRAKKFKKFLEH